MLRVQLNFLRFQLFLGQIYPAGQARSRSMQGNPDSRIRTIFPHGIQNPTTGKTGIPYLESGIHSLGSRIQDCLRKDVTIFKLIVILRYTHINDYQLNYK